MYFVDRKKITQTLNYMETTLALYKGQQSWSGPLSKLALERIAHGLIEAVIDVGNNMIDGFIMRDPGSYEDIIDIMADERVIKVEDQEPLKTLVRYRKNLVQLYISIDHAELEKILEEEYDALTAFPDQVRAYIETELGPVSAFSPEK